jgi:diaminopimelate decarboxylase
MKLPDFVAGYWKASPSGELLAGGLLISSLVARYGTPAFFYDGGVVERKYSALRQAVPDRFSIAYSVKANPNPAFLRFFLDRGCTLEIASSGEFYQARAAGCLSKNLLFAGPGKTESELELVITEGIGEIHAESRLEIERISEISDRLGVRTNVAVRVNPSGDDGGGAMTMGGKSAPFGVDEEQLDPLLQRVVSDPHLSFRGIHLFVGTQILDHELLLAQYRSGLRIAKHAAKFLQCSLATVDFGGGLGVPYFPGDHELNLGQFSVGLRDLMADAEKEPCCRGTKFILEPGRFLAAEAGLYITRINDIKISRGKKFLILDGGMHHHLAASGNLGQIVKRNFPMAIVNKLDHQEAETVDVVGPLCTPLDTVGRSVSLPLAEVGDIVAIFQSGAYARSASPVGFLSHRSPPEVWIENGQDFLVRHRGSSEDYIRDLVHIRAIAESNV